MFKEYVSKDIENIFVNVNEFSEVVTINGVSVCVNIDNDKLSQKAFADFDGVVIGDILFYISADEFKKIPHMRKEPKADDALLFNGKPCIIINVTETVGMYQIALQYSGGGR